MRFDFFFFKFIYLLALYDILYIYLSIYISICSVLKRPLLFSKSHENFTPSL